MENFKIHILGCGSALPTIKHASSSQVIELRNKLFMIDCGEGTQTQLRRHHIPFSRIQAIFISHLHGDHCFGIPGIISTFGLTGRTAPLHIYAPANYEAILQQTISFFCQNIEFKIIFHSLNTNIQKVIFEDRSLTIETIPLQHRIECCGFLFREKPTKPHIIREMIDFYNIPISQINNIKAGADWVTPDGKIIPNKKLTYAPDTPRSYAYCSDTKFIPHLYKIVENVNTLYHESTYTEEHADKAKIYLHSTAKQAATVASKANVGKLILGHYSARYDSEATILKEAREIFTESYLSNEGDIFNI